MPDPTRLVTTLQRALALTRATPGRQGRVVDLTSASEVIVAGDLHGNVENLRKLLLRADLAKNSTRHLVVQEVVHGPQRYPGGGDKSHQLVDLVAALVCQFPNRVHYLPGNHELSEATGRKVGKEDDDLNQRFRAGVGEAYWPHDEKIYGLYCELFRAAPVALRTANRVLLSHSLPGKQAQERFDPAVLRRAVSAPEDLLPGGAIYAVVWGRDTREDTVNLWLKQMDADWLITGHLPCDNGYAVPSRRQIVLDAANTPGCYCLFPTDRPLIQQELISRISAL